MNQAQRQCYQTAFQLVTFTIFVLSLWWIFAYLGGLTYGATQLFYLLNWHQLLMLLAFMWCFSNAVIVYRIYQADLPSQHKTHIVFQTMCLVLSVAGLTCVAVWKFKEGGLDEDYQETSISSNNFYSFHSWCGVITMVAFLIQYTMMVVPGWRDTHSNLCIWLIVFTVVCALTTMITGIEDIVFYREIDGLLSYSNYVTEGYVVNCMVILLLVLLFLILWAWFRVSYSATDREGYQDVEITDNTHMVRPMKGEFV